MKARMPQERQKGELSRYDVANIQSGVISAGVYVLVKKFHFGTKEVKGSTPQIQTFISTLEYQMSRFSNVFESEICDGLLGRLQSYGYTYKPTYKAIGNKSYRAELVRDIIVMLMQIVLIERFHFGARQQDGKRLRIDDFKSEVFYQTASLSRITEFSSFAKEQDAKLASCDVYFVEREYDGQTLD